MVDLGSSLEGITIRRDRSDLALFFPIRNRRRRWRVWETDIIQASVSERTR